MKDCFIVEKREINRYLASKYKLIFIKKRVFESDKARPIILIIFATFYYIVKYKNIFGVKI